MKEASSMLEDREFMLLCARAQEGDLSESELRAFEKRLLEEKACREAYLRLSQLKALLELDPPSAQEGAIEASLDQGKIVRLPRFAAVMSVAAAAMIAVLLTLGLQSILGPSGGAGGVEVAERVKPVATLLFAEDCVWSSAESEDPLEGQRLQPGLLALVEGTAVVRFDGGAEMVLSAGTEVELVTPASADLRSGEVVVRAEDGAEGFVLGTPSAPLVDLGTEFAVRVAPDSGRTELHVHEGEVAVGESVVTAGKAVRLEGRAESRASEEVALDAPRFADMVRKAEPRSRADLMRNYAGFNYDEGILPLEQSTTGKGWAGPWRLRSDEERRRPDVEATPEHLKIVHGQLNVTWPVPGGRLGMLEMPSNGFYVRDLTKPIRLDEEGVIYLSLMVKELGEIDTKAKPRQALRLSLRDSRDYWGETMSFGYGPTLKPQIQSSHNVMARSPHTLPPQQTTLWIAKIVTRKDQPDEVYFRIYNETDELDYAEPADWHVVVRDLDLDAHFDRLLLSSSGISPRIVDEIRIGPTWRSVAPLTEEALIRVTSR